MNRSCEGVRVETRFDLSSSVDKEEKDRNDQHAALLGAQEPIAPIPSGTLSTLDPDKQLRTTFGSLWTYSYSYPLSFIGSLAKLAVITLLASASAFVLYLLGGDYSKVIIDNDTWKTFCSFVNFVINLSINSSSLQNVYQLFFHSDSRYRFAAIVFFSIPAVVSSLIMLALVDMAYDENPGAFGHEYLSVIGSITVAVNAVLYLRGFINLSKYIMNMLLDNTQREQAKTIRRLFIDEIIRLHPEIGTYLTSEQTRTNGYGAADDSHQALGAIKDRLASGKNNIDSDKHWHLSFAKQLAIALLGAIPYSIASLYTNYNDPKIESYGAATRLITTICAALSKWTFLTFANVKVMQVLLGSQGQQILPASLVSPRVRKGLTWFCVILGVISITSAADVMSSDFPGINYDAKDHDYHSPWGITALSLAGAFVGVFAINTMDFGHLVSGFVERVFYASGLRQLPLIEYCCGPTKSKQQRLVDQHFPADLEAQGIHSANPDKRQRLTEAYQQLLTIISMSDWEVLDKYGADSARYARFSLLSFLHSLKDWVRSSPQSDEPTDAMSSAHRAGDQSRSVKSVKTCLGFFQGVTQPSSLYPALNTDGERLLQSFSPAA